MGLAGLLLVGCSGDPGFSGEDRGALRHRPMAAVASSLPEVTPSADERWYLAVSEANRAAQRAATATTVEDWQQVASLWGQAALWLQGMPEENSRYAFSQRRAQDYLNNLLVAQEQAQQQAQQAGMPRVFPPLGSGVLDEQISLYHSYVATLGVPDVWIIGSSRALQGVDPQVLQQALAVQGRPHLRVYNLSVNGATAQVMSFMTRQLLAEDMHPRLVIWAEGARGLNSGRFDRTFAAILDSPGYATARNGSQLSFLNPTLDLAIPDELVPTTAINSQGFLPVNDQFNPAVYYRSFPRVLGQYDDTYRAFRLDGVQTMSLEAMIQFFRSRQIPLVFVNLPLSNDYLDPVRLGYERQFQHFLQTYADQGTMTVVDLLELWRWQSHFFADPSHINRYGAREIARILAEDSRIPWPSDPKVEE
ncbi:MAG: hypothetical protein VKI82_03090 [Leptolyngbya sp.]|nr:hypothetical protein [Leptolyngbya sp.]